MSNHMEYLDMVVKMDVENLRKKEIEYGSSWLKRGGVGSFMMLARKWDRIEEQVKRHGWDVFQACESDKRPEGLLDDIRDLRRYLILVESEIVSRHTDSANKENPLLQKP